MKDDKGANGTDIGAELLGKTKGLGLDYETLSALRTGRSRPDRSPANLVALSHDHSDRASVFLTGIDDIDTKKLVGKLKDKLLNKPGSGKEILALDKALKAAEGLANGSISQASLPKGAMESLIMLTLLPKTIAKLIDMADEVKNTEGLKGDLEKILGAFKHSKIEVSLRNDIGTAVTAYERSCESGAKK